MGTRRLVARQPACRRAVHGWRDEPWATAVSKRDAHGSRLSCLVTAGVREATGRTASGCGHEDVVCCLAESAGTAAEHPVQKA